MVKKYTSSWASLVAQLVKNFCNAQDPGSISGLGRSPGEGIGYPLQYSGLENSCGHKESGTTSNFDFHYGGQESTQSFPYL